MRGDFGSGLVGGAGRDEPAQSFGSSSGRRFIKQGGHACETWGIGCAAQREVRDGELALERAVSKVIRAMPFLWLAVDDEPGPQSQRGYIERNAIALLSNRSWPLGAER